LCAISENVYRTLNRSNVVALSFSLSIRASE